MIRTLQFSKTPAKTLVLVPEKTTVTITLQMTPEEVRDIRGFLGRVTGHPRAILDLFNAFADAHDQLVDSGVCLDQ